MSRSTTVLECAKRDGEYQYAFYPPDRTFWRCTGPANGTWTDLGTGKIFDSNDKAPTVTVTANKATFETYEDIELTAQVTGLRGDFLSSRVQYDWLLISPDIIKSVGFDPSADFSLLSNFFKPQEDLRLFSRSKIEFVAPGVASDTQFTFAVTVTESFFDGTVSRQTVGEVTVTVKADSEKPRVTLYDLNPKEGRESYTAHVVFTEEPTGANDFEPTDFKTTNVESVELIGSGLGTIWQIEITPEGHGEITVQLPAGSFTDRAGNENEASRIVSIFHDLTNPVPQIGDLTPNEDKSAYTATITFTEPPSNGEKAAGISEVDIFTADDLTVENATAAITKVTDRSWTVTLTPLDQGDITLSLERGKVTDIYGNSNEPSNEVSVFHDSIAPTVTLGALTPNNEANPTSYTSAITLSEAPGASTAFAMDDLVVTGARVTAFSGSGTEYTATLTPSSSEIEMTLMVGAGAFKDAAGNDNEASATVRALHDIVAPGITLGALTANDDKSAYTSAITLSEAPASGTLIAADLTLENATATLNGSGTSWEATLTPADQGAMTLQVEAGKFTDVAGNDNTASNTVRIVHDDIPPTVTLGALTANSDKSAYTSTITLSEAPASGTAFETADLTAENATVTLSGSGTSFTATLTPTTDQGVLTLQVGMGAFKDAVGNDNTESATVRAGHDTRKPTIIVGSLVRDVGSNPVTYTSEIMLSEVPGSGTAFAMDDVTVTGADVTAFSGSGTEYTATLTPSSSTVEMTLQVGAAKFKDRAGNDNVASNTVSVSHDVAAPTVSLGHLTPNAEGTQYTSAITLSETPKAGTFTSADLTVENATATLVGSGTSFTATLTPTSDLTTITLTVETGVFEDLSGNGNAASITVEYFHDKMRPTVTLGALIPDDPNNPTSYISIVTLSEANNGPVALDEDDFIISGATVRLGKGSTPLKFDAIVTPDSDQVEISVMIRENGFQDTPGNLNEASNTVTITHDTRKPTVTLGALTANDDKSAYTSAITLSEVPASGTAFEMDDLTVTGAGVSGFSGSGMEYTATLTPTSGQIEVALMVGAGRFKDAAGNDNAASDTVMITHDVVGPTVTLGALIPNAEKTSYTSSITLSEAAKEGTFLTADLTVENATAILVGSGTDWTATLTPSGQDEMTLHVEAAKFTDEAGNDNMASNTVRITHDTVAPTVSLGALTANSDKSAYTSSITLSEAPASGTFTSEDLTVENATAILVGSGTDWTATLTPSSSEVEITLQVESAKFTDMAGNDNTASNAVRVAHDTVGPMVMLDDFEQDVDGEEVRYASDITLSEMPANGTFTVDDLILGNAKATLKGEGMKWKAMLTPQGQGNIVMFVGAGAFRDTAGNSNAASNTVRAVHDTVSPTVTLGALTANDDKSAYTSQITLSEAPASGTFTAADLTVENATATLNGSGTDWTATLTPADQGAMTLQVEAAKFTDASGNDNEASNTVRITHDTIAPTVALGALTANDDKSVYTSAITLSEAPKAGTFTKDDLTVENATAALLGSGTSWTATLTPTGQGAMTLMVGAAKFTDAADNDNEASNTVRITHDTIAPTVTLGALTPNNAANPTSYTSVITLSETPGASTAFAMDDLTVTGARVTAFSGSGTSFTATLTPSSSEVEMTLMVGAGAFKDAAGNDNEASATVRALHDIVAPTITLGALTANDDKSAYTSAITLSEAPATGTFIAADLTLENATATLVGSGTSWEATLTPADQGEMTLQVEAGKFTDVAGNDNTVSNTVRIVHDDIPPTVTLGALTANRDKSAYTSTITLSETPGSGTAFAVDDLTVENATVTLSGSGTSFTATLTPTTDQGVLTLQVGMGAFKDAVGNESTESATVRAGHDTRKPTVIVGSLVRDVGSNPVTYTSEIMLSEAPGSSTAFAMDDVTVTGASVTAFSGSGTDYTATLTPSSSEVEITLQVGAAKFKDAAGNDNVASNTVSVSHDVAAPTVSLGDLTPNAGKTAYTSAITLSEVPASNTFTSADLTVENATAVLSGSGTSWTATLTPAGQGAMTLQVEAGKFTDMSGNGNAASRTVRATHDTVAPTVTLGALTANSDKSAYTSAITLSEAPAVGTFIAADLTLGNATATLSGSGTSWTATLTPQGQGDITLMVGAGKFTDIAGNDNTVSNTVRATHDTVAPTVTLGALTANDNKSAYTSAITLSEVPATGTFVAADLTVSNATATLTGSGMSWTATLTPVGQGAMTLMVGAGKFTDDAGNENTASNTVRATHDTVAPTVTLGALTANSNKSVYTSAITLSETPGSGTAFAMDDLTVTGARVTGFSGSGTDYTASLTPSSDKVTISLGVEAGVFKDAAGNDNVAPAAVTIAHDLEKPTVTLGALTANRDKSAYTSRITLSEVPGSGTVFAADDLTVVGAVATLVGSGTEYTASLTPLSTDVEITLQVEAAQFTDSAGNDNVASDTVRVSHDASAPTVMLGALTPNAEKTAYTSAVTLSEAPATGTFTAADLTVENATATLNGSGMSWTATLTPLGEGEITLQIEAGAFTDDSDNENTASNEVSVTRDTVGPTVRLGALTANDDKSAYTSAITLSESPKSGTFTVADLTLGNATATLSGSGMSWTATLTPAGEGDITLQVEAGAFTDDSDNENTASNEVSATHDTVGPTVALGELAQEVDGYTSSIVLNEAPAAGTFTASDLTVVNATATLVGSGTSWTATLTPVSGISEGDEVTLTVGAGVFTDAAGNDNTASNTVRIAYDPPPSVSIEGLPDGFNNRFPLPVRFVFSEPVDGFVAGDVVLVNAVLEDFVGEDGDVIYTANIVPDGSGDIEVRVPSGVAQDVTNLGNLASEVVSVVSMFELELRERISEFMHRRATSLLSNQPDIFPFIRRVDDRGHINANFSGGYGTVDASSFYGGVYNIWIDARGSVLKDGSYLLGSLGSHIFLTPNVLLGVMVQGDYMRDKQDNDALIKGYGWLVGPYFGMRAPNMDLYFDGRILYGQTSNHMETLLSVGYFDTERWLAKFRMTGEIRIGNLSLLPHIDIAYTEDHQKSFTDELGRMIGGQHIWLRDLTFGLDFDYPLSALDENGELNLNGGLSGIWNESGGTSSSLQVIDTANTVRSRADLGFGYRFERSVVILDSFYDGLGISGYESYGGFLKWNMSF